MCTSAVQNPFGSLYVGYINRFVTIFVTQSHHLQIVLPSTMSSHYRWLFTAIYHFVFQKLRTNHTTLKNRNSTPHCYFGDVDWSLLKFLWVVFRPVPVNNLVLTEQMIMCLVRKKSHLTGECSPKQVLTQCFKHCVIPHT